MPVGFPSCSAAASEGPAAGPGVLRWIFKEDLWLQEVFQGRFGKFAEFKQNN